MIQKCVFLGDSSQSIPVYKEVVNCIQNPFEQFNTESRCLKYFTKQKTQIPPEQKIVEEKDLSKQNDTSCSVASWLTLGKC